MFYILILFCTISFTHSFENIHMPFKNVVPFPRESQIAFIPQQLDHFDASNNQTWLMRVLFNDEFFKPGGPIFIMVGGEFLFVNDWFEKGLMYDMAQENNAYMLYTEHRFYGGSVPTSDLMIESLLYLTPEQALADLVTTIRFFKSQDQFSSSKVILVGGSYAGNLALWARAKYPDEVHAAVSSSAPLKATFAFDEYHSVVEKVLGKECSSVLSKAIRLIMSHLGTPSGTTKVQNDFRMCNTVDLTDPYEIMYLISIISTHFGGLVQNRGPSIHGIVCNQLVLNTGDEYTRLVKYLNDVLGTGCKKGYNDYKTYMSSTTKRGNLRQWMYQSCTQFGFFQTTQPYMSDIFGDALPSEMYQKWCTDFFAQDFDLLNSQIGIKKTNMVFGGLKPFVTRVVSVHGTGDPWHKLGLLEELNSETPVIVINGTYHCQDLYPEAETDSEELKNARRLVRQYIKNWLEED